MSKINSRYRRTFSGYAVLVVFYEHTLHLFWFQALLPEWVIEAAPKGFPTWLF